MEVKKMPYEEPQLEALAAEAAGCGEGYVGNY